MFADVDLGTGFLGIEGEDGLLLGVSTLFEAAGTWASPSFAFIAATVTSSGTFSISSLATRVIEGFSLLEGGG